MNRAKVPFHDLAEKQAGSSPQSEDNEVRLVMDSGSSDSSSTGSTELANDPDDVHDDHDGEEEERVLVSDNNDDDTPSEPQKKRRKKTAEFKKHPDAPKRFRSAFILYSQTRHKGIREGPMKQSRELSTLEISNIISDEWRTMNDIDRRKWEKLEQLDKERFDREKAAYRGPWKIKTNLRKPRDPTTPKKPVPAHFAYCNERRLGVKRQHPEATNGQVSKILSEMWKAAPEEEKKVYYEQEEKAKAVHEIVMEEWRQKKKQRDQQKRDDLVEDRSPKEALPHDNVMNAMGKLGRECSPSSPSSKSKKKISRKRFTNANYSEKGEEYTKKSAKKKRKKESAVTAPHEDHVSKASGFGRNLQQQNLRALSPELQRARLTETAPDHQHGVLPAAALYAPGGGAGTLLPPPSAYAARFLPPGLVLGAPTALPPGGGGAPPPIHPMIPPPYRNHPRSTPLVTAPGSTTITTHQLPLPPVGGAASRTLSQHHHQPPLLMAGPTASTQWVLCRVDDSTSSAYPFVMPPPSAHHLNNVLAAFPPLHEQPYGSLTRETEFRRRVHSYYAEEIEARVQERLRATGNFRSEDVMVRPSSVHSQSSDERSRSVTQHTKKN